MYLYFIFLFSVYFLSKIIRQVHRKWESDEAEGTNKIFIKENGNCTWNLTDEKNSTDCWVLQHYVIKDTEKAPSEDR